MTSYVSILSCLSGGQEESSKNDCDKVHKNSDENLSDGDQKEITEIVEDLMTIQNKDVLRRNLVTLVTENITLKKQRKQLQTDLETRKEAANYSFQIDCDGAEDEVETECEVVSGDGVVLGREVKAEEPGTPVRMGSSCFNCGEGHILSECSQPRDQRRIAKNRREFQANNNSLSSARYHEDEPQKFGHLTPGLPSSKLREALGLRTEELPRYLYRMRELGYPPGWLRHAEIRQSGISLYHERGRDLKLEEEGEVVEAGDRLQYDTSRLLAWPGFNADIPKEFRDDSSRYRAPRLSSVETVEAMKARLRPREQRAYVRGEMQDTNTTTDMDTGDQEGEIEEGPPGEEQEVEPRPATPPRVESQGAEAVTQTDSGTPIVELHSPFAKLPRYDNFGLGMTEHIAFENLPNYTGTWDKMRGVLRGVRDTRAGNKEDS